MPQLVLGAAREQVQAALDTVSKITWSFYSSFLEREQEVIEAAVQADSINRKEGGVTKLKAFLEEQLKQMQ